MEASIQLRKMEGSSTCLFGEGTVLSLTLSSKFLMSLNAGTYSIVVLGSVHAMRHKCEKRLPVHFIDRFKLTDYVIKIMYI